MPGSTTWTNGRLERLLGIDVPVVQGPFGGGMSSADLVVAVSEAGGLGSYGANILEPDAIGDLVATLRSRTSRPFAVNLWVPRPGEDEALRPGRARFGAAVDGLRPYLAELGVEAPERVPRVPVFAEQVDALFADAPPVVSFVMGVPPADVLARARSLGVVTMGTATTVAEARALAEAGVDAVVAAGADGGGHRGSFLAPVEESLVGTFSLVPQVVDAVAVPVVAAGGIADGRGVAAALALGADGVQIGTGFLTTDESSASPGYREVLLGERAATTVLTRAFSGRYARAVPNRFTREMAAPGTEILPYPAQNALTLPIRRAAAARGDAELLNLWSGQAAALSRAGGARAYLERLVAQTDRILGGPGR